jgi:hypothetical protein
VTAGHGPRTAHNRQAPWVFWKNSTPRYVGNSTKHCLTGVTRSACPPPVANVHPKPCTLIKGKQSLDHDGFVIAMLLPIKLFRISQVGCRQWAAQAEPTSGWRRGQLVAVSHTQQTTVWACHRSSCFKHDGPVATSNAANSAMNLHDSETLHFLEKWVFKATCYVKLNIQENETLWVGRKNYVDRRGS